MGKLNNINEKQEDASAFKLDLSIKTRGIMLVLSSPSGAGKTTIARRLVQTNRHIEISISVTTRPRRPGEVSGQDYHFVTPDEFNQLIAEGAFLEYAKVFGHYYGTLRQPVEDALASGRDVLFDIDWQGTQQLAQIAPGDLLSVFILPPSLHELERRLRSRAQDSDEVVAARMSKATDELSHWAEYTYVVINRDLEDSVKTVKAILKGERHKRARQEGLADFVKKLMSGQ